MNKKRIVVYIIAAVVLVGSSSFVYASKNSVKSTKSEVESEVVEAEKIEAETKTGFIEDEEAVEIATKAMKDYLNKDADYFTEMHVSRQDWSKNTEIEVEGQKYMVSKSYAEWIQHRLDDNDIEGAKGQLEQALKEIPSLVIVTFRPKDLNKDRFTANYVEIDADTREILGIYAHNNLESFNGEADVNKIKESIEKFFQKINTEVDKDSILGKYDVDNDFGRVIMHFNLIDGKKVSAVIDLKDYSVISYTKDYIRFPK